MNFKNFLEAFETTHDFLLNQDYSDKTFSQLLHDFEQSGGKMIGVGKYGQVFQHPNWNYVLKTFHDDTCYLKFCRFVYKNPHPSFPKFYGLPKKIIPQFKRTRPILYYVRIEKLYPAQNIHQIVAFLERGFNPTDYHPQYIQQQQELLKQYNTQQKLPKNQQTIKYWDIDVHLLNQVKILEQFPQLKSLAQGFSILLKHQFQCALDIHQGNIMLVGLGVALAAELLLALGALVAGQAAVDEAADGDAVALLVARHLGADGGDDADDLVAGDDGLG